MISTLLVVASLAAGAAQELEPPPRAGYAQWKYTAEKFAAGQVVVFSLCIDKAPCVHIDPATARTSVAEWYEWKLPPLIVGPHTATIQACNAIECGEALTAAFTVKIVPAVADVFRVPAGGDIVR